MGFILLLLIGFLCGFGGYMTADWIRGTSNAPPGFLVWFFVAVYAALACMGMQTLFGPEWHRL